MNVLKRHHHVLLMQFVKILKEVLPAHVLKDIMVTVILHLVQVCEFFCLFECIITLKLIYMYAGVGTRLLVILVPVINGTCLILLGVIVALLIYLKCRQSSPVAPTMI